MNFIGYHKLYGLQSTLARTDGKLKSHESCSDVRAWSHDLRKRDRYLREWIKCDMPFCAVPISTLIGLFSAMTCRSRGRTTPRCHPDCKARTILESITVSCEAIRECLKADRNLEKFFCDEEFESSTWPCERCLEALKSIKMFWKIILEKVFAINLTKNEYFENVKCESVRDVARHWQRDMVQQAIFVKQIIPRFCQNTKLDKCCKKSCLKKSNSLHCFTPSYCGGDKSCTQTKSWTISPAKGPQKRVTLNCTPERNCRMLKKICKCTCTKVQTADACCGCTNDDEIQSYKAIIDSLRKTNCCQREEIERLTRENRSLKCELQNIKSSKWNSRPLFCATALVPQKDNDVIIPKPFENYFEDDNSSKSSAKGADSELLITMKNCKNESFKQVSLLQVLHKTNNPCIQEDYVDEPCYKNEDPIELLTKVQATLGAMVKREMTLATTNEKSKTDSEIEASFQRIGSGRPSDSDLSCMYD